MAVEVKYGKESKGSSHRRNVTHQNLDLRHKHNDSQQKLQNYLDQMFEKEEREKQKLQRYLYIKKLESLEYLKMSKLEAQEKKRARFSTDSGIHMDEEKLK